MLNVERWILACLRNQKFFSLAALNKAIRSLLKELNHKEMKHLGKSRQALFESLDQPALRLLPASRYEYAVWKKARVSMDYHIEFEKHYYSVPHILLREYVYIRATERTVEIFFKEQRVALHPHARGIGGHTTLTEHMPPSHQYYSEWSSERFIRWAEAIGSDTARLIQIVLNSRPHPQQAFRACMGILSFNKTHGPERLETACQYALAHEIHTYRGVKNILENQLDRSSLPQPSLLLSHPNIRGKDYYN